MKRVNLAISANLTATIKKAADFHGHLGPFLVIGVRMGDIAKKFFNTNTKASNMLEATAKIPLLTPFSCVIDGIQATTRCTIGNQRLRIENSQKEITICFKLQNSDGALKIFVNPKIMEELMNELSAGASNEELAWKIACLPQNQLFMIEK